MFRAHNITTHKNSLCRENSEIFPAKAVLEDYGAVLPNMVPPSSAFRGAGRVVCTEIDEVCLLCAACEIGQENPCKIPYWIRDEENVTECSPPSPMCPKCPQWAGMPCGESGGESADIVPSQQSISNNVVLIEQDGEVFAVPVEE